MLLYVMNEPCEFSFVSNNDQNLVILKYSQDFTDTID